MITKDIACVVMIASSSQARAPGNDDLGARERAWRHGPMDHGRATGRAGQIGDDENDVAGEVRLAVILIGIHPKHSPRTS